MEFSNLQQCCQTKGCFFHKIFDLLVITACVVVAVVKVDNPDVVVAIAVVLYHLFEIVC